MNTITRFLMLFVLCLIGMQGNAQNVTISPKNGSMICALTEADPTTQIGYKLGSFGSWVHNQLSLTMTGSNDTELTDEGQLKNHANHFTAGDKCVFNPAITDEEASNYISAAWGSTGQTIKPGYITIALPKGYRFTGYRFLLSHDIIGLESDATYTPIRNYDFFMDETDKTFNTTKQSVTIPTVSNNTVQVVEFTRTGNDMGNVLYFKTYAQNTGYCELNFRYVELKFTADANASVDVLPGAQVTSGVSLLEMPINTGKVDFGEITKSTYNEVERYSYIYNAVGDMSANMLLYEKESVKDVTAAESFDGTVGKMAYSQAGSITTAGDFVKLNPGDSKEQVYFLETPTYATMSNGGKNPIQFRIVGANIEYDNGSDIKKTFETFRIRGRNSNNGSWNYMGTSSTQQTQYNAVIWYLDEESHVRGGNNGQYFLLEKPVDNPNNPGTQIYVITTTEDPNEASKFKINGDYLQIDGGDHNNWYVSYGAQLTNTSTPYYWRPLQNLNTTTAVRINKTGNTASLPVDAGTGQCTLKVYGANGTTVVATEAVNSRNTSGTIPLTGLNNDAIKFSVQGTGYVKLNVILQALNPYIDQMTVVLNDNVDNKGIRMTRTFTADDFSVGGDTFRFYLPEDCAGDDLTITFEDLYSKYGDQTYDHTNLPSQSDSRYNFVQSQHYQAYSNDNIYNNTAEAANDTKESVRIAANNGAGQNVRTKVGIVGDAAFRFNNADVLASQNGYMTEYPFTLANYAHQTNGVEGNFITAEFNSDEVGGAPKTFYVFTTDETKYNIAPTTATQHRFYAFYQMIVEVLSQNYTPQLNFVKVYDKTCYGNNDATDPFYGVKVYVPNIPEPLASDMATYKAIATKIAASGDNNEVPKNIDQILYLDMSELHGVYHSPVTNANDAAYAVSDFNDLKSKLATNALVFLPANSTATFDNFAFAKKGEVASAFQAANNIVLTDKQPFFSPFDIQVDAAKYAKYSRQISQDINGKVNNATLILPFALEVESGVHTNATNDACSFSLNTMDTGQTIVQNSQSPSYVIPNVKFSPISGTSSEANKPYMVKVLTAATGSDNSNYSFVATQAAAQIVKTPTQSGSTLGQEFYTGETASGTYKYTSVQSGNAVKSVDYTCTAQGNFSGVKYDRTESENVFYFAANKFLNLHTLNAGEQYLLVYPFRSVYTYTGNVPMNSFNAVFGDELENTDAIAEMTKQVDLAVTSGKGFLSMTSAIDQTVNVRSLNGMSVGELNMRAGDSQSINLPAGIYLVNNVKIIVK